MRERLTWQNKDTSKQASPPPQTPNVTRTEAPDHPAYKADPGPDDYLIGDGSPSQFAEDVHPGPYATSAAPATPGYQEPADHPAARPGQPMKASEQKRKSTERKAARCIRIAASMFGEPTEGTTEEQHIAAIENHALDLMDLPDDNIKSMLQRLGMDDESDDDDDDTDKEASMSVTAAKDILASIGRLEHGLSRIAQHMGIEAASLFGQMDDMMVEDDMDMDMDMDMPMDDEEGMLDEMLADAKGREHNDPEYGYAAMDMEGMDEEEMLAAMLSGSHFASDDDDDDDEEDAEDADTERTDEDDEEVEEAEGEEEKEGAKKKAKGKIPPQFLEHVKKKKDDDADDDDGDKKASDEDDGDIILASESDPMGLMDTSPTPDASELAKLYMTADDDGAAEDTEVEEEVEVAANKKAKAAEDQDEASDEDDDAKMSAKKASRKPQPKKPSNGAQALGNVTKVASSEAGDLSSLWEHAPDVSSVFS